MAIEDLEGIANVQFGEGGNLLTESIISDSADWKSGTLDNSNVDVVPNVLRVGWGDTAHNPTFHTRFNSGSGNPVDVSDSENTPNNTNNLNWNGQTFRGQDRLEFNGNNTYIDWGDHPEFEFGGTSFTIEWWYYYDSSVRDINTDGNAGVIGKTHSDPVANEQTPWYLSRVGNTGTNNGEYISAEMYFRDSNSNDDVQRQFSTTTDVWRHHAFVYDLSNTEGELMLNGTTVATYGVSDDPWGDHGSPFVVGVHSNDSFPGTLANMKFTKSALTNNQLDYTTTASASGYSLAPNASVEWRELDFASVSIPSAVTGVSVDLKSLTSGIENETITIDLADGTTNYDISSLADGDEIQLTIDIDLLDNVLVTPEIEAPVDITYFG